MPIVLGIVFLAALVRATFGFGDALLGMPLLALFIPLTTATPLMAFVGQGTAGLWTAEVLKLFLWSIPVLAAASGIGRFLSRRIPPGKFNRWVYGLLLVSGAVLAAKVIF